VKIGTVEGILHSGVN